jgi:hypothetical protein
VIILTAAVFCRSLWVVGYTGLMGSSPGKRAYRRSEVLALDFGPGSRLIKSEVPEHDLPGSGADLGYNAARMLAVNANISGAVVGSAGLVLAYGLSLWRIFKSNPGDKFIQSASVTVWVFVVTIAAIRIHYFPEWVLTSLEVLLYLLTFLSIFFMSRDGYRALRHRKTR